jgi:hypothetical protein
MGMRNCDDNVGNLVSRRIVNSNHHGDGGRVRIVCNRAVQIGAVACSTPLPRGLCADSCDLLSSLSDQLASHVEVLVESFVEVRGNFLCKSILTDSTDTIRVLSLGNVLSESIACFKVSIEVLCLIVDEFHCIELVRGR